MSSDYPVPHVGLTPWFGGGATVNAADHLRSRFASAGGYTPIAFVSLGGWVRVPGSVIVSFARTPIAKFWSTLQALGQCPLPVAQLQFNGDEKMDRVFVAHDCGPACAVTIDPSSLLQSGQHAAAQNGAAEAGGGTEASDSHLGVVGEGECRADATEVVGHCQPMPTAAASSSRVESDECDVGDAIGGRHFGNTANRRAGESPGVSPGAISASVANDSWDMVAWSPRTPEVPTTRCCHDGHDDPPPHRAEPAAVRRR